MCPSAAEPFGVNLKLRNQAHSQMTATPLNRLVLRDATFDDWRLLYRWRNDIRVRTASRNPEPIDEQTHRDWLTSCLQDSQRRLLIAELNGNPVGTIRVDFGPVCELSWTVAPEARGKGIGGRMVCDVVKTIQSPMKAVTRNDNFASQRIAVAAGFELVYNEGEWMTFQRGPGFSETSND